MTPQFRVHYEAPGVGRGSKTVNAHDPDVAKADVKRGPLRDVPGLGPDDIRILKVKRA